MDGLDEITITDKTKISELWLTRSRTISSILQTSFIHGRREDLRGAMQRERRDLTTVLKGRRVFAGTLFFECSSRSDGIGRASDFREGIKLAEESIDSGSARKKLEQLKVLRINHRDVA